MSYGRNLEIRCPGGSDLDLAAYLQYFIYVFTSIFIIVNPIEATMVFVSLTQEASPAEKSRICVRTTLVAFSVAMVFALAGDMILRFFGITVDSLRVAGGILLFLVAIDMLRAKPHKKVTEAEIEDATTREDISIFPLAIPLLTGPGAITTVIVNMGASSTLVEKMLVLLAICLTFSATYAILRSAEYIDNFLGVTGIMVFTRIMGLILGAIAVDFVSVGAWNIYISMASGA
ncbi:MarC family protein [Methanothrix sp.]|uniref:MarC family protein n=1 Tax=Methanothrix sp. TaxID=90426 RepID=UPI003C75DB52